MKQKLVDLQENMHRSNGCRMVASTIQMVADFDTSISIIDINNGKNSKDVEDCITTVTQLDLSDIYLKTSTKNSNNSFFARIQGTSVKRQVMLWVIKEVLDANVFKSCNVCSLTKIELNYKQITEISTGKSPSIFKLNNTLLDNPSIKKEIFKKRN